MNITIDYWIPLFSPLWGIPHVPFLLNPVFFPFCPFSMFRFLLRTYFDRANTRAHLYRVGTFRLMDYYAIACAFGAVWSLNQVCAYPNIDMSFIRLPTVLKSMGRFFDFAGCYLGATFAKDQLQYSRVGKTIPIKRYLR